MADENQAGEAQDNTNASGEGDVGSVITDGVDNSDKAGNEQFLDGDKKQDGDNSDQSDDQGDDKKGEGEAGEVNYDEFKMPEGFEADKEALDNFTQFAKDRKYSQEDSQELVDMATNMITKERERGVTYWKEQSAQWAKDVGADPELGGINMPETKQRAQRAVQKLNDPELTKLLKDGFGNHPALVRALVKYDRATGEAKSVNGGEGAVKIEKSAADTLYPDQGK